MKIEDSSITVIRYRYNLPLVQRAMAGSYAYFPKALLRLSPSDVMARAGATVGIFIQVAQSESSL